MKKFAILLLAAIAVIACKKDEPITPTPQPEASIQAPAEVRIAKNGAEVSFLVKSTTAWTAATTSEWLIVTPTSGKDGETEVKVSANAFEEDGVREATLIFTAGEVSCKVTICQIGNVPFSVSPMSMEFGSDTASMELAVTSEDEFTLSIEAGAEEWLTIDSVSKKDVVTTIYKVSVKENPVYMVHDGNRDAKITFTSISLPDPVVVTVHQDGKNTSLNKSKLSDVVTLSPRVTIADLSDEVEYGTMVSIAILGDNLIVCGGDGSAPTILDKKTGENKGKLNIGDIKCFSVANDDAGHLLISNRIAYSTSHWTYIGGNWLVYYMSSTTDTPHKLIDTAAIPYGCVGAAITCRGDVTADAIIGAPTEFPGLTVVNEVTYATIKGGKQSGGLNNIIIKDHPGLSYATGCWNTAPSNFPAFVFKSASLNDGAMIGWYDDNHLWDMAADGKVVVNETYEGISYASNLIAADMRDGWLAYIGGAFFPEWNLSPEVFVYDANNHKYVIPTSTNGGEQVCTTADIAIETVEGGVNIYYVDYNCNIIEGMFIPTYTK